MKHIEPIALFNQWYEEELKMTKAQIPSAVCLSTVGTDNFPNARFVSLKEVIKGNFIITGPLNSRKGIEINKNNKVALTFWWTATERQIRVQGVATKISEALANRYFHERSINSKAVSLVCEQGKTVKDMRQLEQNVLEKITANENMDKPKDWGGFSIRPVRMEFMEFKTTRFHDRKLFEFDNSTWLVKHIQP